MDASAADWEAFATATLGAAAVLIGLIFVAVALNLGRILKYPWLVDRAGEAIVQLFVIVAAMALLLVPGQPVTILGLELIGVGLAGTILLAILARTQGRKLERAGLDLQDLARTAMPAVLARASAGIGGMILFVIAGASLLAGAGGGLYWVVPATLLTLAMTILTSWVLLIEVDR